MITACFLLLTSLDGNPVVINPTQAAVIEAQNDNTYFYMGSLMPNWSVQESLEEVYQMIQEECMPD